jgi:hypothetical protein
VEDKASTRTLGIKVERKSTHKEMEKFLIEKLEAKVKQLQTLTVSKAGRVIIVNSVLESLLWYFALVWAGTKSGLAKLTSIIRYYLFSGGTKRYRCPLTWDTCTKPKSEGGLGILDIPLQVKALTAKWMVRALHPNPVAWKTFLLHCIRQTNPMWAVTKDDHPTTTMFINTFVRMKGSRFLRLAWEAWREVAMHLQEVLPPHAEEIQRFNFWWSSGVNRGVALGMVLPETERLV